jgi:hypothetical protein
LQHRCSLVSTSAMNRLVEEIASSVVAAAVVVVAEIVADNVTDTLPEAVTL